MVAVIYVGGLGPAAHPALPQPRRRIAADSGLDLAVSFGVEVDLVIGDFDSVDPQLLADARRRGAEVREHPVDKDLTDLELAIGAALDAGPTELVIIGGGGGRLDHLIGVVGTLAGAALGGVNLTGYLGDDVVWMVGPGVRLELTAPPDRPISLMPVGGTAVVHRANGLQWPLDNETLGPYGALGVSNRVVGHAATIEIASGVVAVIAQGPDVPQAAPLGAAATPTSGRFRRFAPPTTNPQECR